MAWQSRGWTETWALVLAEWRAGWNRYIRFSRAKAGLWLALAQLAVAVGASWRLKAQVGEMSWPLALALIGAMGLVGGFLGSLLGGRRQLYGDPVLRLVHLSPAPAGSVLVAVVLGGSPGRLWTELIWSAALTASLPGAGWIWALPLTWLAGIAAGSVGQLAGYSLLVLWVRAAPRTLGPAWAVILGLQLAAFYYILYLLVVGTDLSWLPAALTGPRGWLPVGVAGLVVLLVAAMAAWFLRDIQRAGEVYRESWLNLAEVSQENGRLRRSLWPALIQGPAGAVQAKEVLQMARNPFTWFRLGAWAVALVVLPLADALLGRLAPALGQLFFPALGLGWVLFCFGELLASLFSGDGALGPLYVLAGLRPARLMAGKLLAGLPFGLLAAVGTWAAASAAGAGWMVQLRLSALAGAVGIGVLCLAVGVSAAGASLEAEQGANDPRELALAFQQIPRGVGAWAGFGLSLPYAAAGVWLAAGRAGAGVTPWLAAGLEVAPVLALAAGYLRLRRLLG